MPGNLLSADTSFPTFTPEQTNEQKLDVVTNYLYMLLEQLRYTLANLGAGNFNETELDEIGMKITQPIYVDLENAAGAIADLTLTADQLTSRLEDAEGNISSIEQYARSITLSVSNGETSSTIKLLAGGVQIASQIIQMDGLVTFTGLEDGTTVINGGCIQTGTIDAQYLNLTGAITFPDLSSDVQGDINGAIETANDAYDLAYDNQLPSYIKSTYIDSTRIESPEIYGGEIYALNGSGAYAKMDDDSFSLMYEGSSIPRAVLQVSNTDATLVLGVGSGTSQDAGRFFITKSSIGGGAAAILYMLGGYDSVGMAFTNNGEIIFNANKVSGLYMEFE